MDSKRLLLLSLVVLGVSALGFAAFNHLRSPDDYQLSSRLAQLEAALLRIETRPETTDSEKLDTIGSQLQQLLKKFDGFDRRLSAVENNTLEKDGTEVQLPDEISFQENEQESAEQNSDYAFNPNDPEKVARNREYLASLDRIIMQEGVDQARTAQVSIDLSDVLASKPEWIEGAQLGATECSTSLCRTEFNFSRELQLHPTAAFELEHTLLMKVSDQLTRGKLTRHRLPDGSQQLTVYLTQNGSEFPAMQQAE